MLINPYSHEYISFYIFWLVCYLLEHEVVCGFVNKLIFYRLINIWTIYRKKCINFKNKNPRIPNLRLLITT